MDDRCAIPYCRKLMALTYLGQPVCAEHWHTYMEKHADKLGSDALRRALKCREPEERKTNDGTD